MYMKTLDIDAPQEVRKSFINMRRIAGAIIVAAVIIALVQFRLYLMGLDFDRSIMVFNTICIIGASIVVRHSMLVAMPWFEAALAYKTAAQRFERALSAKIAENEELRAALLKARRED